MTKTDKKALQLLSSGIQTPFYVYDSSVVLKKIRSLNKAFSQRANVLYSMKANPNFELLSTMAKNSKVWVDVCSIGEAKRALQAGFPPTRMSFVGPGKSVVELEFCIKKKIQIIVIESEQELEIVNQLSIKLNKKVQILLRIALKKTMSLNGKVRENYSTHFGISEDQIYAILAKFNKNKYYNHIFLNGLHCYVQSNYLDLNHIFYNFKSAINLFREVSKLYFKPLNILNLGGGFGVDYFDGQKALDLNLIQQGWASICSTELSGEFNKTQIQIESGRYLMADAGSFYCKILYTKECYGKSFLVLDGGFTQNMSATGFGQLLRRNFPIRHLSSKSNSQVQSKKNYTLVGPSCYSVDVLSNEIELENIQISDLIVIDKSGSYGACFSPQDFLLRPHPQEFVI